jgi:murein DD-endopeptidase MepM/ murein hydrolase activator NlpD
MYGSTAVLPVSASLDAQKDSLESQKDKIEQELDEINRQLSATKNDIAKQEQYQETLEQQISLNLQKMSVLDQQLSQISEDISKTEEQLTQTEENIAAKEEEISVTADQYKQRMRANYMSNSLSPLETLFSAESFGDFLTGVEMMKAISRHDTQLLEQLRVQQAGLENEKSQAERVKADLAEQQSAAEQSRTEMEQTNQELEAAYQQSETATQNLELERQNFEANKEQRLREAEEIDREIEEIMQKIAEQNAQQGGNIVTEAGFLWPLPNFSNVNSAYGWRFNNTDFHTGIDLGGSGVYGADIVAAKSGVVASPMTHWSYGNNVVINHGDGYVTLYAHCSQLLVSPGQTVSQGQVIAKVGATGNVTGPHLHFEVYYNGVRQNPANFIQY